MNAIRARLNLRLLAVVAALLLALAAVSAASAAKPNKRARADARYFYKATVSSGIVIAQKVTPAAQAAQAELQTCLSDWAGASQDQMTEGVTIVSGLLFLQSIGDDYKTYSGKLVGRKARFPALRTIAGQSAVIAAQLEKYATATISICALGQGWSAAGWAPTYPDTWVGELDASVGFNVVAFAKAQKLIKNQRGQLVKLKLKPAQAKAVVSLASLS
jgi:hypothetical protein